MKIKYYNVARTTAEDVCKLRKAVPWAYKKFC